MIQTEHTCDILTDRTGHCFQASPAGKPGFHRAIIGSVNRHTWKVKLVIAVMGWPSSAMTVNLRRRTNKR
jgi:hypothetical protein